MRGQNHHKASNNNKANKNNSATINPILVFFSV